jgi:hypothetical protein
VKKFAFLAEFIIGDFMPVRIIEYLNKQQNLQEWTTELGLNYRAVLGRLHAGWTVEQAFTETGEIRDKRRRQDILGRRFGHWVVLEEVEVKDGNWYYKCRCDCGNESEVRGTTLTTGVSHQCLVCAGKIGSTTGIKHGLCSASKRSKIWRAWQGMKTRCYNENSRDYANYGARGIYVFDEWRNDVVRFYEDMGDPPSPQHSLGRIDNDGPYAPWNCRWETMSQQNVNKRPGCSKWRKAVYERDGYKCKICGSTNEIEAHHLDGWALAPERRHDVENGVTLCLVCHSKFHKEYGQQSTTEQFNKFATCQFLAC